MKAPATRANKNKSCGNRVALGLVDDVDKGHREGKALTATLTAHGVPGTNRSSEAVEDKKTTPRLAPGTQTPASPSTETKKDNEKTAETTPRKALDVGRSAIEASNEKKPVDTVEIKYDASDRDSTQNNPVDVAEPPVNENAVEQGCGLYSIETAFWN